MIRCTLLGATGFIGSHVAEALSRSPDVQLSCVVRPSSDCSHLEHQQIAYRRVGTDPVELAAVLRDRDVVVNCVAAGRDQGAGQEELELAWLATLVSALGPRTRRFVHLSSIIAYGSRLPPHTVDESFVPPAFEYALDRIAARKEDFVVAGCRRLRLPYAIVQPTSTIGLRDRGSFCHRLFQAYHAGRFPLIAGGKANVPVVDTRDVGAAFALLVGAPEQAMNARYIVGGYNTTWRELKDGFDRHYGKTAPVKSAPRWLIELLMRGARLLGRPPLMDARTLHALCESRWYDDSRIRALGYAPRFGLHENLEFVLSGTPVATPG